MNQHQEEGLIFILKLNIICGCFKSHQQLRDDKWNFAKGSSEFTHPNYWKSWKTNVKKSKKYDHLLLF